MSIKLLELLNFRKLKREKFHMHIILRFNQACPFGRNGSKESLSSGIYLPEEQLLTGNSISSTLKTCFKTFWVNGSSIIISYFIK